MLWENARRRSILFAAVTTLPLMAHATEVSITWNGSTLGSWNNSANWNPAAVPNDGADTYDVFVDGGKAQNTSSIIDFSPTILSLNISAGDTVTQGNGQTFTLVNALNNAGTFIFGSTGSRTAFHTSGGTVTISGGETIVMVPNSIFENGGTFVNSDNTIQGTGNLAGNNAAFINSGIVNANVTGAGIFLDSAGVFTNNGTMIASNGGSLQVSGNAGGGYTNNGTLIAQTGSVVQLRENVVVAGGTYSTVGTGSIDLLAHDSATLTNFTNTGAMFIENGGSLFVGGNVVNSGSINFVSGADLSQIRSNGNAATFSGGGIINIASNTIFANGAATFTNTDNTIQGAGNLGGNVQTIVNNGTVNSNVSGAGIFVDSNGNSGSIGFFNNGTMLASNSSTLNLSGNAGGGITNNGTVIAANSATVLFSQSILVLGSGTIIVQSGGTVSTGLNGGASITTGQTTINGTWKQDNNSKMLLTNFRGSGTLNITNSSSITVAPNGTTAATSRIQSLSIDNSSGLDLKNNNLIVDYAGPDSTVLGTIRGFLVGAYDNGAWDKPGLQSTTAGGTSGAGKTGLGYEDTAGTSITSFSGQSVDNSAILIKYTYVGDTNLDGKVDVTDLGALSSHWQQTGNWINGDFNYDGTVNVTDLGLLATNWQQGVISPQLGPESFQQALQEVGLGNVLVPEPAALSLLGISAAWSIYRPRRRHLS